MRSRKIRVRAGIICFLFMTQVILSFFADCIVSNAYTERDAVVTGDVVNVRTGPGTSYSKVIQLTQGTKVTVTDEATASDGKVWYKIKYYTTSGTLVAGYMTSEYLELSNVIEYQPDADFEAYLTAQGFPEGYKDGLRKLHAEYPNWVFQADHLDYTWDEVLNAESVVGRNLIAYSSISSWKSVATGAYDWNTGSWVGFDGGSWAAASPELIAYCLDPRNFLDDTYIFQFELLSYQSATQTSAGLQNIISGTFLDNSNVENGKSYSQILMEAASISGVSPYHLASRILQEIGTNGTSGSISGTYPGYEGYYNYFNIGAYATSTRTAVESGLYYAQGTTATTYLRPWNTRYAAIVGGATYVGNGYVNIGQDTLYYQKFDFIGTPYTHQYMTHVLAPKSESLKLAKAYTDSMRESTSLVFKIPVYQNMPDSIAACPSGDGSPSNILSGLSIDGQSLSPSFSKFTTDYGVIVSNNTSQITINATAAVSSSSVSGTGVKDLAVGSNTFNIIVTAANGATRTYTITVVRNQADSSDNVSNEITITSNYALSDNLITGLSEKTSVSAALSNFTLKNCTAKLYKADGSENTGYVTTGTKMKVYDSNGAVAKEYTFVIYGDVNGDGIFDSLDMLYIKRHLWGIRALSDVYLVAADTNRKNDGIDSLDMLYMKRQLWGIRAITQ